MSERKHSQCDDFSEFQGEMNNKIIEVNELTDSHQEDRKINASNYPAREMVTFLQGTRISCEIHR